jgi:hypothetical protein
LIQSAASVIQQNSLVNQADASGLPQRIVAAIKTASNQTGVDFSYLLKKASQESSLNPNASASSSSATGLYQFTRQTWLQMVKNYGDQYGLGAYADHIQISSNGVAHVSDPTWRSAILNLRKDPQASAEMAGELDKENQAALQDNVGGKIGGTELYLAHFLGAGGASAFLNEMRADPRATAASVLPEAAAANPAVFYAKDGTPRSLSQIYQHFAQKFDGVSSSTLVASASPVTSKFAAPQPTMTVASTGTSSGSYTPSIVTSGVKAEGSSLIATMILAQMNEESAAFSSGKTDGKDTNKKTPFDLMNMANVG